MKKKLLSALVALFVFTSAMYSIEMSVGISPEITFPTGGMAESFNGPTYGGRLNYDFNLFGFLTVGPEFTFSYIPKIGKPSYMLDFAPGLAFGGFYNLSRFTFGGQAAGGLPVGMYDYPGHLNADGKSYEVGKEPGTKTASNFYLRASGEVLFRVSPEFSVGATAGYTHNFLDSKEPYLSGFQAGIVAKLNFDTKKSTGNVNGKVEQDIGIFPLYANVYKTNEIASIHIVNGESAEIRKVNVYFRAENYTSSMYPCGSVKRILRNKSADIPLLADFAPTIFNFTENGQIPGEVVIEYEILGKKKTATTSVVLTVNNRNSFQWADSNALALFVSPNAETIMELSKSIVGNARDNLRTGVNRNMQFAMYVTEYVNAMGIVRVKDATTPYATSHLDYVNNDYIQYPFQTIIYSGGDSDDMGVLVASLLSSAGLDAAFMPLNDDFVVCVSIGDASSVGSLYNNAEESLLIIDDWAWLPLSMNDLSKGFNSSWSSAMKKINAQLEGEEDVEFIVLQDVWEYYPPMGFDGKANYTKPSDAEVKRRVTKEMGTYTQNELMPIIRRLQSEINKNPTESNYNALGMAFVRADDYASAKQAFNSAYKLGSVSAMLNLANIATLQNNFADAKWWYNEILKKDPEHAGAKKGLERLTNEQGK